MTNQSRVQVGWPLLLAGAIVFLIAGAGLAYMLMRSSATRADMTAGDTAAPPATAVPSAAPAASGPLPDVVLMLTPEAADRAGIVLTPVTAGMASGTVRAPGVVEPNAYKRVAVTPLVSGRVTRVAAELGQHVKRGQMLAQIFSPELAEWQTRYVSARAELEAHERELARTEKLVAIGAASQQELERVHAAHTAHKADVRSAATRLQLLGVTAGAIEALGAGKIAEATTNVPAPIDGVVTERLANTGLNVDQTTPLFTVVDLSTVWVVVEVFEKDFARVQVGSPASIVTTAYPDRVMVGRVSYIDPQVNPDTRTAKARVEVSNTREELRLGMFAEAVLGSGGGSTVPMIPRTAVQNVGDRTVVYLANPKEPGKFIEREVRLGAATGDRVAVLSGVDVADIIVAEGSFHLRAERERLGLRGAAPPAGHGAHTGLPAQDASVSITDAGFDPPRLTFKAGVPAKITFTRRSEKTCATEVVFPSLNIRRDLPLNQPVVIEFTPEKPGEVAFACGMNMFRGSVVIQ